MDLRIKNSIFLDESTSTSSGVCYIRLWSSVHHQYFRRFAAVNVALGTTLIAHIKARLKRQINFPNKSFQSFYNSWCTHQLPEKWVTLKWLIGLHYNYLKAKCTYFVNHFYLWNHYIFKINLIKNDSIKKSNYNNSCINFSSVTIPLIIWLNCSIV